MTSGDLGATQSATRRQKSRELVRQHYRERGWQSAYDKYEKLVSEHLAEGDRVLDVGCGRDFPLADYLKRCGAEVHGIDLVDVGDVRQKEVTVRRGSAEKIPYPDDSFDMVTSRSVLEHLKRPTAALREFHRVLRPGGHVVFLTPSRYDYVSLAARLIPNALHGCIIRKLEGREEVDTFATFYRANSAGQVRRLARVAAFEVEHTQYVNHYPYLLTFSPVLCRIAICYDELISSNKRLSFLKAWLLGVLRKPEQLAGETFGERDD